MTRFQRQDNLIQTQVSFDKDIEELKRAVTSITDTDTSTLAPKDSPVFTGNPTAPTPLTADNDTSLATTAFVKAQGYVTGTHTHAQADITNLVTDLAAKAPLASPVFTGNPTAPTPLTADNDTSIATTAFVKAQGYAAGTHTHAQADITNLVTDLAAKAPLASPVFTGNPTAPTPLTADNDTSVATTAYVKAQFPIAQSSVTNLVTDLAGKAATSHTHPQADITNLVTDLSNKATTLSANTFTGIQTFTSRTDFTRSPAADGLVARLYRGTDTTPGANILDIRNHADTATLASINKDGAWDGSIDISAGTITVEGNVQPTITRGAAFPGSPSDGDIHIIETINVTNQTNSNITWAFMYESSESTAHKWRFIGGPPICKLASSGPVLSTQTAMTPYSTTGLGVPKTGIYIATATISLESQNGGARMYCAPGVIGAAPGFSDAAEGWANVANACTLTKTRQLTVTTAQTVEVYFRNATASSGSGWFSGQSLYMFPVKVTP